MFAHSKFSTSNSPSSSIIVTINIQPVCTEALLGREDELMVRMNDSFVSYILLSIIVILNQTLISPAGTIILNGPDS